jgi:cell division protein ZapA
LGSVNVTINSRQYRIGCEDGQESHLEELAKDFDARIAELRERIGEVGDARLTIMAALTVADDLSEMKKEIERLKENMASLQDARTDSAKRAQAANAIVAAAFDSAAERLETIAKKLNQTLGSPGLAQG